MGFYSLRPWFREQLKPLATALHRVHPEVLTWSALGSSILAGVLLFCSYDHPWMAVAVVPLLVARLALNTLDGLVAEQSGKSGPGSEVLNEVSDRLADIAILLGLTLSAHVDKVLGLLAIIAVLMVSYVGILGKAVGTQRVHAGILGKEDRMVLVMLACLIYGAAPTFTFMGYSVFGILFLSFIPLASLTLLQRLDLILCQLSGPEP